MSSLGFLHKITLTMRTKDRSFWRTACSLIPGIHLATELNPVNTHAWNNCPEGGGRGGGGAGGGTAMPTPSYT